MVEAMHSAPVLRLQDVTKQYPHTSAPAVAGVSLSLVAGEILGLLGPSGCGKTTLLRLIGGFERPDGGEIHLATQPIATAHRWVPPEQRSIGMVFQDFALFPHLTVRQNVAFGLQSLQRQDPKSSRDGQRPTHQGSRTQEALALVGLAKFADRYPHELSGGQQQRVALARALAPRPTIILLDEPLSNLDVQVRLYLRQEVREILKRTGISAVFVTHDQEEALSISDKVAVMRRGHLEQVGAPEEIYANPASQFVAEFVTQANFLTAQRRGESWETEAGTFYLPMANALGTLEGGMLMIRQEDLLLEPDEAGTVWIRDRQFLGREYNYCLQTPSGQTLHARMATGATLPTGSRVRLKVDPQALRIFPGHDEAGHDTEEVMRSTLVI
ncbi:ABC transporter ATP-binding protein [Leptolyngbya sp. PCC 6406]|uniref:ABC transporter ATP-binding protein n=1 Tax=Leptolyngbya sp. PCC 6406 TaxID=1173264 RepID=UPI0002AD10BC|nr:ABC transporter ATP-binding protein [Leptolyngbya sp. PCC 6406]